MIKTVLAYILLVPIAPFCMTIGVLVVGFLVAFLLAWAPVGLRIRIAGACGGLAGVGLAIGYGHAVFWFLLGPGSFTTGALWAVTLPLLFSIWNDCLHARRVALARDQLLHSVEESRGPEAAKAIAEETGTAHGSTVVGEIAGVMLAAAWGFFR